MKKIILPLIVTWLLTSCSSLQNKLASMSNDDFMHLAETTFRISVRAGEELAKVLDNNQDLKSDIKNMSTILITSLNEDKINTLNLIEYIISRFELLNIDNNTMQYIKDAALFIDSSIGRISIGINGKFTDREKTLIINCLDGLSVGIDK